MVGLFAFSFLLLLPSVLGQNSFQTYIPCDPNTQECRLTLPGTTNYHNFYVAPNVTELGAPFTASSDFDLYLKIQHVPPLADMYIICFTSQQQRLIAYGGIFKAQLGVELYPSNHDQNLLDGAFFSNGAQYRDFEIPAGPHSRPLYIKPWIPFYPQKTPLLPVDQITCQLAVYDFQGETPQYGNMTVEEIAFIFKNVRNPCESNPCQNGGVCTASPDGYNYTCDCTGTGFIGPDCGSCVELYPSGFIISSPAPFHVILNTQPAEPLTVRLSSDCALLSKCTFTFTPENWNVPQEVTAYIASLQNITTVTGLDPALNCPVTATVVSNDLCNGNTAETLGIIINPENWNWYYNENTAYSTGDPHFRTFDGQYHHFYDIGDFYFVRGLTGDFVIQTRQEKCGARASCNSGVAIKIGDVIIYFSSRDGVPGFSVIGDALANEITVEGSRYSYTVSHPDGISIRIWAWTYFSVYVTLPENMHTTVAGLAGFYNGIFGDDYFRPDGVFEASQDAFHQSWRVPEAEDLFVSESAIIPDISASFPVNVTAPPVGRLCTFDSSSGTTGKLQQNNGTSPFENTTVPYDPDFSPPSCYDNATLLAEAEAACDVYFQDSVAQCCKSLGVNATGARESCVCDFVLSGDPAFIISAVEAFYSECDQAAASQNTTCEACPNACTGNGACGEGGVCTCNSPFQGNDCSEDWSQNPMIASVSVNAGSGCPRSVTISGKYFFGTGISCEFNVAGTITTKPATTISNFQVLCDLPPFSTQGSVSLSVKVIRSDTAMSSSFSFSALPSCCDGLCVRGTCTNDNVNGFTCSCPSGYEGDFCETFIPTTQPPTTQPPTTQPPTTQPPEPCDSSPCLNAGTCTNVDASTFSCSCPSGISGDVCEFAGPVVNLDITTAGSAGSGTTSEILVTFVGSTGSSGPHSLGSFADGGSDQINLQLYADIGTLYALDLVNTGDDMWRVQSIDVTGELTGSFGWNKKVRTTKTLELPFTISYQTKSGVDDGCAAGVYIRIIDVNGVSPPEFALFGSTTPGEFNQYDIPYLNLAEIKKIRLGSFTEDTWDFDFITITRRGVTYTFTNTLGAPFSRTYQLAQFFPQ